MSVFTKCFTVCSISDRNSCGSIFTVTLASVPKNNDAGSKSKTDTPTNDDTNNPAKVDSKSKKTD